MGVVQKTLTVQSLICICTQLIYYAGHSTNTYGKKQMFLWDYADGRVLNHMGVFIYCIYIYLHLVCCLFE